MSGPSTLSQMFPPSPTFTEKELGDLSNKVFIVTGANSGVGFELAKMLYGKNGKVYIAARSPEKIKLAITSIQTQVPRSNGQLAVLKLDLADLSTIKASAEEFLGAEDRLDVLVHNAGVMTPPPNSKTKLGHDLEMGTNCLGPFLFNHFLEPLLKKTAATASKGSVRIVWLSSLVNISTPKGGILYDEKSGNPEILKNAMENYMESKAGNLFLAAVEATRLAEDGVISMSVHPGFMKTELQRNSPALQGIIMKALFKGPQFGAYSELFAGFSPNVTMTDSGRFVVPWGRFGKVPDHMAIGLKSKASGGTGAAQKFWDWCERETKSFM